MSLYCVRVFFPQLCVKVYDFLVFLSVWIKCHLVDFSLFYFYLLIKFTTSTKVTHFRKFLFPVLLYQISKNVKETRVNTHSHTQTISLFHTALTHTLKRCVVVLVRSIFSHSPSLLYIKWYFQIFIDQEVKRHLVFFYQF